MLPSIPLISLSENPIFEGLDRGQRGALIQEFISYYSRFVILPINLPAKPNVTTLASELNIELRVLKHWDQAPSIRQ